jgi:pimeloyl-ACP methyl ester carboxylesterase
MAHRSEFLDVRGVRTHLLRGGRGHPLLVLHPEFAANTWAPYHDALAAHFVVLAPDHLGFGGSDRPASLESIDDLVLHYVDLLDVLEIERVSIVGSSLGGWIAAAFAVAHPERVERLVLAAPAGIKVDGVPRYDYFINPFERTLDHLFHDRSRAAQLLPAEYGPEVIVRAYHELATLARLSWNPYLYDPKLQQQLPRLLAPTLLIWGEDDTVLPPPHAEAFAALVPGATLKILRACGHLVPFERVDEFTQLTLDFLNA